MKEEYEIDDFYVGPPLISPEDFMKSYYEQFVEKIQLRVSLEEI
jgi:hypothetical protein